MAQRIRSRDARTGRRRLVKLLAATGTLAGGLWFSSHIQAAEPSPADSSSDLHGVTLSRVTSVCRVLGLQRRSINEPRTLFVQPCQALAPVVSASAEAESMPNSFGAPSTESSKDGLQPVTEAADESASEPADRIESEDAVRLLRPIPGQERESNDASASGTPGISASTNHSTRGREFSPFRSNEPTDPAAPATSTELPARAVESATSYDAGDRMSAGPPSSPTAPHGGASTEFAPVVGRRTARATNATPSPKIDSSRQTIETIQEMQAAQSGQAAQTRLAPRRPDLGTATAFAGGEPLFEVIPETGEMSVAFQESKMLRLREPIGKVAVVDPTICEVVQFSPREICLLGKSPGTTNITFWVGPASGQAGGQPATYRVTVEADQRARELLAAEYHQFEQLIGELFPQSNVRLLLIADKVIVKGEARDETEAMRILSVLRQANAENPGAFVAANGLAADFGPAARLSSPGGENSRPFGRLQLINMLHIAHHPNDLATAPPTTPADTLRNAKKP